MADQQAPKLRAFKGAEPGGVYTVVVFAESAAKARPLVLAELQDKFDTEATFIEVEVRRAPEFDPFVGERLTPRHYLQAGWYHGCCRNGCLKSVWPGDPERPPVFDGADLAYCSEACRVLAHTYRDCANGPANPVCLEASR